MRKIVYLLTLATTILVACNDGVTINGVTWATRNVGEKGQFIDNPEDYGLYYTFDEAQTVCPKGWRTPTRQEFVVLARAKNEWTILNGVAGSRFGSGSNTIFLPAAGTISYRTGSNGAYWSGTPHNRDTKGYYLFLYEGSIDPSEDGNRGAGFTVRCVKGSVRDQSTTSSSSDGVTIKGITWATRNVGAKGQFVNNPEDYGYYYNFEEAQTVCPQGWRTPTKKELKKLDASGSEWTELKGVAGRRFGRGSQTIFLPAAGLRSVLAGVMVVGRNGDYWSGTPSSATAGYHLRFLPDGVAPSNTSSDDHGFAVRCVKK